MGLATYVKVKTTQRLEDGEMKYTTVKYLCYK